MQMLTNIRFLGQIKDIYIYTNIQIHLYTYQKEDLRLCIYMCIAHCTHAVLFVGSFKCLDRGYKYSRDQYK